MPRRALLPRDTSPRIQSRSYTLAGGDAGTARTVTYMRAAATGIDGAKNPHVRQLAIALARGLDARDYSGQVAALFNYVKNNIEFRGEYEETLQTPIVTLQMRAGDCDDKVTLLASLLLSLGFQVRPVTVAADPLSTDFSHVYLEVQDRATGNWIPLDTTVFKATPGWKPRNVARQRAWRGMGQDTSYTASYIAPSPTTAQALVALLAPLSQAAANKITYGDRTAMVGVDFGQSGSNIPGWVWAAGILGALYAFTSGGRRR
jgi:transglutaminase-like putative cysteine protease